MENISKTGPEVALSIPTATWAQIETIKRPQGNYVRKTMTGGALRLEWQYEWLKQRESIPHLPKPEFPNRKDGTFAFEMKVLSDYTPFFDFIHANGADAFQVIENLWEFLDNQIHVGKASKYAPELYDKYIAQKLQNKIQECLGLIPGLSSMLAYEHIEINGMKYRNFKAILRALTGSSEIRNQLSRFVECPVHGDLTIENILVSPNRDFLLLDPNGENIISSPLIDLAKLCQSLRSGYEYMIHSDQVLVKNGAIFYRLNLSDAYRELFQYLKAGPVRQYFQEEGPAILFHEAMHFARLLPYRAQKAAYSLVHPDTFFIFYANMIKLFNEFLDEVGHHEKIPSGRPLL